MKNKIREILSGRNLTEKYFDKCTDELFKLFTDSDKVQPMNLHDTIKINGMTITRVIGGWIYEIPSGNTNRITSQFIPFNNEFLNI